MDSKLKQIANIKFKSVAFKTLPVADYEGYIIIESRSQEKHEVEFHVIDLNKGKIKSTFKGSDEWWNTTTFSNNHTIVLSNFDGENNPQHTGVELIDIKKHKKRQFLKDYSFLGVDGNNIILEKDNTFFSVSNYDGVKPIDKEQFQLQSPNYTSFETPLLYDVENEYYSALHEFTLNYLGDKPEGSIEYFETNNHIIFSYNVVSIEGITNYFCITDLDGTILVKDVLASQRKGVGNFTFFKIKDCIYYIKDRFQLIGYQL